MEKDPGDPIFAEFAEKLVASGQQKEAVEICLKGLSKNPECHRGRLALAYAFFKSGYIPFALREIEYLSYFLPENQALKKLLNKFDPIAINSTTAGELVSGEELADMEFDLDALQEIDDDKKVL